jgi:putative salt-induced outer membrane protein YdiY
MKFRASMLVFVLVLAAPLHAAEEAAAEEEAGPLAGNVRFGFLSTTGNTETTTMNTGAEATYTLERWTHKASGSALYSDENNVTTAEAYEALWRSDWSMTDKDALFGRLIWRKDRFGGFATQFSQTIGYARKILTGEKHLLSADVGVGARQSEDQLGINTDEAIYTAGMDYTWKFSDTAKFQQTLAVEVGNDNTFSESVSSVTTTLVGALSLVASHTIRHNSDVPIGTDKRDTRTAVSLQYDF